MKIKHFTHTDLDGVGCGILAEREYGDNVEIEYCDYDNINEKVLDYINTSTAPVDLILITDISVNEDVAERLEFIHHWGGVKIKLIDHHGTATWLNKYKWAEVNPYHP